MLDRRVVMIVVAAALGGLLLGFDATVISGVVPLIQTQYSAGGSAGSLEIGWVVSSLGWGAMLGNIASGRFGDRYGRRAVLRRAALLFLAAALLGAAANGIALLAVARIIGGIGVGAAIVTAPTYIAEIAPAAHRGALVSVNQLTIVLGISLAFFSNFLLLPLGPQAWRWMLGVQALPAAIYIGALWFVPESPRWLLQRGQPEAALRVLTRLRGQARAGAELRDIARSLRQDAPTRPLRELWTSSTRRALLFGLGLAFFQQATGINAVFYYLPTLFAQAGGSLSKAFGQSVLVGCVNVAMTLVAMSLIDRIGRRPLLCWGMTGMAAALFAIAWGFRASAADPTAHAVPLLVMAIIGFVASFAVSLGPGTWVLLSEIFPNEHRARAIAVAGLWNSLVSASVVLAFPRVLVALGPSGTFVAFGCIALLGVGFLVKYAPEGKGRSLEELAEIDGKDPSSTLRAETP